MKIVWKAFFTIIYRSSHCHTFMKMRRLASDRRKRSLRGVSDSLTRLTDHFGIQFFTATIVTRRNATSFVPGLPSKK